MNCGCEVGKETGKTAIEIWDNKPYVACVWCDVKIPQEYAIVDGHNRFEIATKHDLDYDVEYMHFESREKVIEWMILNQFGRRNLNPAQRSILALKLKPIFEEKARENQLKTLKQYSKFPEQEAVPYFDINSVPQKSAKRIDTREELAKIAGVSHDTIAKVQKIEEQAPEPIKEKCRNDEISINKLRLYHYKY